jgi:hypothetical protein
MLSSEVVRVVDTITSKQKSYYDRALAVRSLGFQLRQDAALQHQLGSYQDAILDALMELIRMCRTAPVQTLDTRKVHVNCCVVLSMLMQDDQGKGVTKTLSLNSAALDLAPLPKEFQSKRFLSMSYNDVVVEGVPPVEQEEDLAGEGQPREAWGDILNSAQVLYADDDDEEEDGEETGKHLKGGKGGKRGKKKKWWPWHRRAKQRQSTRANSKLPTLTQGDTKTGGRQKMWAKPTQTVIFGSEAPGNTGLDANGNILKMHNAGDPAKLGYAAPTIWFPHERPKTADDITHGTHEVGAGTDVAHRPWGTVGGVKGSTNLLLPSKMIQIDKQQLLPPQHFLRMLDDGLMPAAVPEQRGLMGVSKFRRLNHSHSLPALTSLPHMQKMGASQQRALVSKNESSRALASPKLSRIGPLHRPSLSQDTESEAALRRTRMKAVVSHPAQTTEEVAILAAEEHSVLMTALGEELGTATAQKKKIEREIDRTITADWAGLPMTFLMQLPGGMDYVRDRLRRILSIWIVQFERGQMIRALRQWQALVEVYKFKLRTGEYRRQAAAKLLQKFVHQMILAARRRVIRTWCENIRWLIWVERDAAALTIQTTLRRRKGLWAVLALHDAGPIGGPLRDVYLAHPRPHLTFCIPARIRAERRPPWQATIRIQAPYRGRKWRRWFAEQRAAAIIIQAAARMWSQRGWYRQAIHAAIVIQADIRRIPFRRNYLTLAPAARKLQRSWRGHQAKKFFRVVKLAKRREVEKYFERPVMVLQRRWRSSRCKKQRGIAKRMNSTPQKRWQAALRIQKAWYSREEDGFPTFLLVGCLREQDTEVGVRERKLELYRYDAKARIIQRALRAFKPLRIVRCAERIQGRWRVYMAKAVLRRLRYVDHVQRRLHWWARGCMQRRHYAASRIQFYWWKCVPGRFLARLRWVAKKRKQAWATARQTKVALAATCIQAMVHGAWTRDWLRRMGAAVELQRVWRGKLGRGRWRRYWVGLRSQICLDYTVDTLREAVLTDMNRQRKLKVSCTKKIQRVFRGWLSRYALTKKWIWEALLTKMVIRVQHAWRAHDRVMLARLHMDHQRRAKNNPYKNFNLIGDILRKALADASAAYDPHNPLAGTGLPTWLRQLGCLDALANLASNNINSVANLKGLDDNALKGFDIKDKEARGLILAAMGHPSASAKAIQRVTKDNQPISSPDEIETLFVEAYSDEYITRAKTFKAACQQGNAWHGLTKLRIQRHFSIHSSPAAAREHLEGLIVFPQQAAEEQRDLRRKTKCLDQYQYGLELASSRIAASANNQGTMSWGLNRVLERGHLSSLDERLMRFRGELDVLLRYDLGSSKIQRNWRGRADRTFAVALRRKQKLGLLEQAYSSERNMKRVLLAWRASKKREKEALMMMIEVHRASSIVQDLQYSFRFGWYEDWDEETQRSFYKRSKNGERSETRPVYNCEEDSAAREVQRTIRGFLGRCAKRHALHVIYKRKLYEEARYGYDQLLAERRQHVTIRLRFNFPSPSVGKIETVAGASLLQFAEAYNRDLSEQSAAAALLPPSARPPDGNCDALLDMMNLSHIYANAAKKMRHVKLRIEYTMVQMPYGWEKITDPQNGGVYYYNSITFQTAWEKPEYTYEEDQAARVVERQYRAYLGRQEFKRLLAACSLEDVVLKSIRDGAQTAWVGHGIEGMSSLVWLTRMGMQRFKGLVQVKGRAKKPVPLSSLLSMDDTGLSRFGFKKKEDRHRILSFPKPMPQPWPLPPVQPEFPENFAFIAGVDKLNALVLKNLKQELRANNLSQALFKSATPVTMEQVLSHLHKYEGKPKEAQDHVTEVCNSPTVSTIEDEIACFRAFERAVKRVITLAGNKNMIGLRDLLQHVFDVACGIDERGSTLKTRLEESGSFNGLWEPRAAPAPEAASGSESENEGNSDSVAVAVALKPKVYDSTIPPIIAARFLRVEGLQLVVKWSQLAILVQTAYRRYYQHRSYAQQRAWRKSQATAIQLAWYCAKSRALRTLCILQRKSEWQQLWNEEAEMFYFFHNPTEGAIWRPPTDPSGNAVCSNVCSDVSLRFHL